MNIRKQAVPKIFLDSWIKFDEAQHSDVKIVPYTTLPVCIWEDLSVKLPEGKMINDDKTRLVVSKELSVLSNQTISADSISISPYVPLNSDQISIETLRNKKGLLVVRDDIKPFQECTKLREEVIKLTAECDSLNMKISQTVPQDNEKSGEEEPVSLEKKNGKFETRDGTKIGR